MFLDLVIQPLVDKSSSCLVNLTPFTDKHIILTRVHTIHTLFRSHLIVAFFATSSLNKIALFTSQKYFNLSYNLSSLSSKQVGEYHRQQEGEFFIQQFSQIW